MNEGTRFCSGCGQQVGQAPVTVLEPLDFTIHGDNLQVARVRLKTGQQTAPSLANRCSSHTSADGAGEVGFAGNYPGRIQVFELAAGRSVLCQRDAFLFAQPSVQFQVALMKKLGAGFFGGEGFILERFTGPGAVSSMQAATWWNSNSPRAKHFRWIRAASSRSMKPSITTSSS